MLTRRHSGFTLVEVIIASVTVSVFLVAAYQVYRGVMKSFQRTNWSLTAQNYARNGLNVIREEMQRASYRTTVNINSVQIDESHKFHVPSGFPRSSGVIAQWTIGVPFKNVGGVAAGARFTATLTLAGKKLILNKTLDEGDAGGEILYSNKVILDNVESVGGAVSPLDPGLAFKVQLVELEVTLKHPNEVEFPSTFVRSKTAAKVEVDVVEDL